MSIKDFFRKVRILLEGEEAGDDSIYTSEIEPEELRSTPSYDHSASAARLAERMADEYVDPDDPYAEDDDEQYQSDPVYYSPHRAADDYDDGFEDDYDDGYSQPSAPAYEEEEPDAPVYSAPSPAAAPAPAPAAVDIPAQPDRLPTRTEVTLQQIARLSQKLDPQTLREYQMRLVRLKQETGAVSALTALRILHEYVDDDPPAEDDGTKIYPDLSAQD